MDGFRKDALSMVTNVESTNLVDAHKRGNESAATGPQKEKLSEFNPYGVQGGTHKSDRNTPMEKVSEANPFALQPSQQTEDAFFKLVALVLPAVQSIVNPHLEVTGLNSHALQVIEERMGAHNITSLRGGGGPVKFDAQEVGMELDGAIGLLFTQLKALPTVGLSGKVILH